MSDKNNSLSASAPLAGSRAAQPLSSRPSPLSHRPPSTEGAARRRKAFFLRDEALELRLMELELLTGLYQLRAAYERRYPKV